VTNADLHRRIAKPNAQVRAAKPKVSIGERRIRQDDRKERCAHNDETTDGLAAQNLLNPQRLEILAPARSGLDW
jgi:hypothetical protein